jgi:hypothetical protein
MRSTNTVHVALATAAAVTRECDFLWWLLFCREEYPALEILACALDSA